MPATHGCTLNQYAATRALAKTARTTSARPPIIKEHEIHVLRPGTHHTGTKAQHWEQITEDHRVLVSVGPPGRNGAPAREIDYRCLEDRSEAIYTCWQGPTPTWAATSIAQRRAAVSRRSLDAAAQALVGSPRRALRIGWHYDMPLLEALRPTLTGLSFELSGAA